MSPLNHTLRSRDQWKRSSLLLNKFSLSVPRGIYGEQNGEYAYWYYGVKGSQFLTNKWRIPTTLTVSPPLIIKEELVFARLQHVIWPLSSQHYPVKHAPSLASLGERSAREKVGGVYFVPLLPSRTPRTGVALTTTSAGRKNAKIYPSSGYHCTIPAQLPRHWYLS